MGDRRAVRSDFNGAFGVFWPVFVTHVMEPWRFSPLWGCMAALQQWWA